MIHVLVLFFVFYGKSKAESQACNIQCPEKNENLICAFNIQRKNYKMFHSICAMNGEAKCHEVEYVKTPLKFCFKKHNSSSRRLYAESCPVFCPGHYRPVCGASKYRDYYYRTFNNGCFLDLINCRGDDDYNGYVEVPLQFCEHHLMKNIFREKVLISNLYDYRDYNE